MNIAANVGELIGRTPLIRLSRVDPDNRVSVVAKCEFMNPSGSVKDRIGLNMIDEEMKSGRISRKTTIIEPTSGNTGIALASVCASYGISLILTMPDSMSLERRKMLKALGAKLKLSPAEKGMNGSIALAEKLAAEIPDAVILQQFENPANPAIHRSSTAEEIWQDTDGNIDIFIAAVGTGGTLTGTSEVLKMKKADIQIIAVEPSGSPVISGGEKGSHKIQGIGAGFIPKVLNENIIEEVIQVSDEDAYAMSRNIAKKEGILVGMSAGANVHAALKVARRPENHSKEIVTILCDRGERYLSMDLFDI